MLVYCMKFFLILNLDYEIIIIVVVIGYSVCVVNDNFCYNFMLWLLLKKMRKKFDLIFIKKKKFERNWNLKVLGVMFVLIFCDFYLWKGCDVMCYVLFDIGVVWLVELRWWELR